MISYPKLTRDEAEAICRKQYIKQWGKTPEEHQQEINDSSLFFGIDKKTKLSDD